MLLLKVPRWLSEVWLAAPPESIVADLDLEGERLSLIGDGGRGRPSTFSVSRRASPELFAFPAGQEGEEIPVDGPIAEALTVTADLQDPTYQAMLQQRLATSSTTGGTRSLLEQRLIPMQRSEIIGQQAAAGAQLSHILEKDPGETEQAEERVWQVVKVHLRERPQGLTVEELLQALPTASGFLAVRNALAAHAEPVEDADGTRRFVLRRPQGRPPAAPAAPAPPAEAFPGGGGGPAGPGPRRRLAGEGAAGGKRQRV